MPSPERFGVGNSVELGTNREEKKRKKKDWVQKPRKEKKGGGGSQPDRPTTRHRRVPSAIHGR